MTLRTVMGRYGAPKHVRHTAGDLPDDLVHVIFSKLDFKSKVIAGMVCKRWDQLLRSVIAGARHWAIDYNLDTILSSQAFTSTEQGSIVEQFNATIGRWLINRAAAIKVVHVSATLPSVNMLDDDTFEEGPSEAVAASLESQLPLLAGCLAKHVNTLELTLHDGCPDDVPFLFNPAFLAFLCPIVRKLELSCLEGPITASQFAAICELSSLEALSISGAEREAEYGLEEMTSDISKLVKLKTLVLGANKSLQYIPESISCLQKLEVVYIQESSILEVPSGLASLANLSSLVISYPEESEPLGIPPSLQGLKSLTRVRLGSCSLETIPEVLTDLSTLTFLEISDNDFESSDGWSWWPTSLSRLTKLAELVISGNCIVSLTPHISGLRQLTKLDVLRNELRTLPEELSSLQYLKELRAEGNHISTVPVSVLSVLTALTCISLSNQWIDESFEVFQCLLPILHPGLFELDLRQRGLWDPLSLCHLEQALAEVADRTPVPKLRF